MAESGASLQELMTRFPQVGRVRWLGLRPGRDEPMQVVAGARLLSDRGIEGDRACVRAGGKRQVSLIQAEHIEGVERLMRRTIDPCLLRRNVVVSGINLRALTKRRFRLGEALLEWSGECHPCSKLEAALGEGGYNAMRGHGGILARVLEGGEVRVGDALAFVASPPIR